MCASFNRVLSMNSEPQGFISSAKAQRLILSFPQVYPEPNQSEFIIIFLGINSIFFVFFLHHLYVSSDGRKKNLGTYFWVNIFSYRIPFFFVIFCIRVGPYDLVAENTKLKILTWIIDKKYSGAYLPTKSSVIEIICGKKPMILHKPHWIVKKKRIISVRSIHAYTSSERY